jgi:hypothetical protein
VSGEFGPPLVAYENIEDGIQALARGEGEFRGLSGADYKASVTSQSFSSALEENTAMIASSSDHENTKTGPSVPIEQTKEWRRPKYTGHRIKVASNALRWSFLSLSTMESPAPILDESRGLLELREPRELGQESDAEFDSGPRTTLVE